VRGTGVSPVSYTWDAENRLAAVIPKNPVDESKKLKFTYDYMGRRVRKQVFDWDPAAPAAGRTRRRPTGGTFTTTGCC
jgi:hypothetical protein